MVAHVFNLGTQEAEAGWSLSSRSVWYTEQVRGHRETVSEKINKGTKKKKNRKEKKQTKIKEKLEIKQPAVRRKEEKKQRKKGSTLTSENKHHNHILGVLAYPFCV